MSNNNYIAIQLSFLLYILFVFTRFEAFVRNDVEFGYERLASRSCLKRPRSFGNIVLLDVYDNQTAVFCNFYRLINVADYISIILRYIVFKSITTKDLFIPHRKIIVFLKIFSKNVFKGYIPFGFLSETFPFSHRTRVRNYCLPTR